MTLDPPCDTTMAHSKMLGPLKNEAIAPSRYSIRTLRARHLNADAESTLSQPSSTQQKRRRKNAS